MFKPKWTYMNVMEEGDAGGGAPEGDAPQEGAAPEGNAAPEPASWDEGWRNKIAGDDEKMLKRLERFASPKALAESYVQVSTKLSQSRPLLGKDATPEQIKEFREYLGVPENPDGYDVSGFTIKENDKRFLENYLAKAHATNQTNDQVRAGIQSYFDIAGALTEDIHARDGKVTQEATDALREEWGNEYRKNINLINSLMDGAPEGVKANFFKGRLADGTPIGSSVPVLRWLLSIERERNPTGTIVPGSGERMGETVQSEIDSIEKTMRTNRAEYNRDEKMQARYRELLEWRENHKKKAA